MIIFPAVDILDGKAVRLKQGKRDKATVYADNPLDLALRWQDAGAQWLHIVDLNGAFDGASDNLPIIEKIAARTGLPIQIGGGIRTEQSVRNYLEAGASRLIIGTIALEKPDLFAGFCAGWPGKIGVSLDAENGRLKSRGWISDADRTIGDVLPFLEKAGAAFIIYTDIERDGSQTGINQKALANLLDSASLGIIAAGGVASMKDIAAIYALKERGNLLGAISGRALCEGNLDLAEAISWVARQN